MSFQLTTSSHGHLETHQSTCAVLCESTWEAGPFPVTASVEARHAPSASAMPFIRHFVALERGVSGSPVRKSETNSFQTLFFVRNLTLYDYWYHVMIGNGIPRTERCWEEIVAGGVA